MDFNQLAHRVVQATIERDEPKPDETPKTPAQVNGRNGGLKGGKARAEKLTAGERSEIARKAARARWAKEPAR
ncbi:MAG: histone H1 [Solirubrobacteraceae bacterium]